MAVTATMSGPAKKAFMEGEFNLASDTIKCLLATGAFSPNVDTTEFIDDVTDEITGATAVGYTAGGKALTGKTVTYDSANDRAVFDCDPITWATATITAARAYFYKDTGTPSTSRIIGWRSFGENVSSTADTFTVDIDAGGLFRLT